jgi:2-polyprenyl-6-hydroxyphenyl methylase/3-demethylubiquinone-9 3-methyltransferase
MEKPAKNTICLWYDGDAEDAARFYAETFPRLGRRRGAPRPGGLPVREAAGTC